jgi:GNAT superfamily N-acetyltransferase
MAKAASQVLAAILGDAAAGQFPASDGRVTILPQPSARDAGVIAFTGHSVIFADADPAWIASQLPADDPFAAPLRPEFISALARHTGRIAHHCDILTCASALPGAPPIEVTPDADPAHPRISRALRYRDEVRAWHVPGGVVMVGRGIAGRWEVAVEVDEQARGRGLGRTLAAAARHLVPGGAPLWAQIAPGNAASVRAFLAAGFRPVGAECHLPLP